MIFALAGNPNSGKTTLFNQLTGSNQRVGNFPGVTVDQKSGCVTGAKEVSIVDLPGVYSLSPYTREEIVTRDFLLKHKPDGIINIADATNIERSLYLTLQLIELQIPMVLALNMMDEVLANNGSMDIALLRGMLGIPVVPVSAINRQGLCELLEQAVDAVRNNKKPARVDFCSGPAHQTIHAVTHLIEDHAQRQGIPARFAAAKLVEGDGPIQRQLRLTGNEAETIEHAVRQLETETGTDREAALADMRYQFIEEVCGKCVTKAGESREYRRSVRLDALLTHRFWAFPAFFGIMLAVFWLTFGVIGNRLSGLLAHGIGMLGGATARALEAYGLNPAFRSLVLDGVFTGVGAVLGFVPIIVTLFFFLSLLEDSGYMARVAFVMDKPLRKIGLSGRSFVPLLMGFGCTVPALMATRTLPSERDKKMTILLTPFMSCSAKLPIYALFAAAFFPGCGAWVMIGIYAAGVALAVLTGLVMNKTVFRGAPVPFVMELPNYRFPSMKTVLMLLWDKARDFIQKAFTVILVATVITWFLQSFDFRLNLVADGADSMLASVGRWIGVVFAPLGFTDWRVPAALLAGFTAKEAVIGTLAVLSGAGVENLGGALHTMFSTPAALAFMVFTLLYTPCAAAVATAKRELGSWRGTFFIILFQTFVAWAAACCAHQIAVWFF